MRKIDQEKSTAIGKAAKTINFDKIVLTKLEERAKQSGTSVSNLVNMICWRGIMTDSEFHKQMMKHHYMKFQEHKYMKERSEDIVLDETITLKNSN